MSPRILVAGVGNIFLSDDGFGSEVARRLAAEEFPEGVRLVDFGIRGVHLAYELMEGYDSLILIDALPRGEPPGTIYALEVNLEEIEIPEEALEATKGGDSPLVDAHGMEPNAVFSVLKTLGGSVGRALIVGCEPAGTDEGIGLSEPVADAIEEAVTLTKELIEGEMARLLDDGKAILGT